MSQPRTVILGGGIHGSSIAYYLSLSGIPSIIVEQIGIGSAASGKAGGFLARDWGSGPTIPLHQISYNMHKSLATQFDLKSFREIPTLSVQVNRKGNMIASWLDRKASCSFMNEGTAQVTPIELTERFVSEACKLGSQVIIGKATKVEMMDNRIIGVHITNHHGILPCDRLIICLGPWSGVFCEDHFNLSIPMEGIKSTSIVFQDLDVIKQEPYALFCEEDNNQCHLEFYPRPNGDLYVCGCGGSDYVSGDRLRDGGDCENSSLIKEDPKRVQAALKSIQSMSSIGDRSPNIVQACMRPCPPDGLPIMGEIPNIKGAYISAGHNCWGILWAPVSGLAMSELIIEGKSKTIDLKPFRPSRFLERKDQRGKKIGSIAIGEQW